MDAAAGATRRVCVTGAGGFIASWLVKLLLSKGYIVHGTVRDLGDKKNAHLKELENASANLQLFKADMLDYDSVRSAIAGCEGVFHVACPVPSTRSLNPDVEVIAPAVGGTVNVLKASSEAKVKRVVVVSSIVAVTVNPNWPRGKIKDESCWSDAEHCRKSQDWYYLSKTLAEHEALDYAEKHELDVVTVGPSLVVGPLLHSTLNSSSLYLINLIKGVRRTAENRDIYLVDVRDVADALLLVYKESKAAGRHICASHSLKLRDLVDVLKRLYPNYKYIENFTEVEESSVVRSEKLKNLGWNHRTLEETLVDSIKYYQDAGLLHEA
ncbi:cinnamoyl-CoA reductase 1-like [Zingiber officinale]|uniref:cinnamoyl-CoA reductase 1-like n=1 Tax=Zingiber officinale TaxID=94328 RepID=UPI001C4D09B6|nr:cinnamoyl-CoA reductase 1-like [Zingiber officinale]